MCGIAGSLALRGPAPPGEEEAVRRMVETLVHRGPDEDGFLSEGPARLGMRRLKIIDLSTGRQPIYNEDRTVGVVYNGEIYNYLELRSELEAKGHRFSTRSDTEVLVHLYEEEGPLFPQRLRGMFAFALWDAKRGRILLGRDHFGVKPLYWGVFGDRLLFGSEIRALKAHPAFRAETDPGALDDFMTLLFIPAPRTVYRGLSTLEPGRVLCLESDGSRTHHVFWDPAAAVARGAARRLTDLRETLELLDAKVSECVKMMLRSDVPLGVFLSSGLDSSAAAYYASRHQKGIKTFTIRYKAGLADSYNEDREAAKTASFLGTDHTEIEMELPQDLTGLVWEVLSRFDEPFADLSALPTYMLCKEARKHITVALTGDGGDELFGGYPTSIATEVLTYYRLLPKMLRKRVFPALASALPTSLARVSLDYKLKRFLQTAQYVDEPMAAHFSWRGAFYWQERESCYAPSFYGAVKDRAPYASSLALLKGSEALTLKDQIQLADLRVHLPDLYLVKADRMSMAHSLELRPVLLDPELAELAFSIPHSWKIRGFQTKWILRRLLRGKVPDEVIDLPKKGFTPPLSFWLAEGRFQDFVREVTRSSGFRGLGALREGTVERLLTEHKERRADHTRRLWAILSLAAFSK